MAEFRAVLYSMSTLFGEDYEDEGLLENDVFLKRRELKDLRDYLGPRKWRSRIFRKIKESMVEELIAKRNKHFSPDVWQTASKVLKEETGNEPSLELIESVIAIFNRLNSFSLLENSKEVLDELYRRNYIQAIISNTVIPARHYTTELEKLGINHYFHSIICSADFGVLKPDPQLFEYAIDSIDLPAPAITFVADSLETDVKGGVAVGMPTILLNRYTQVPKLPEGVSLAYNLKEILDYLPPL